ncbi:MAG: hypothetical protein J6A54_05495 [Clostridia bacterium]|nr:hypothetical protein [Clostridia bacterium]
MIKGCQKRMIYIKDTGSDLFDEAYFILKKDIPIQTELDGDIIRTATAIINHSEFKQQKKKKRLFSKGILFFLLGCAFTSALATLIFALVL